jgi:phenylpropionate dioxygenase-like ring-hydroxylating dioxygenase large terminal subunit
MHAHTAQQLLQRALLALSTRRPEMAERDTTVPVSRYLDPGRLALQQVLARRHPQPVAALADVAAPGDHVALDRFGVPLLLVRGDDGRLRAFVNVCRHRGARIVPPGRGRGASRFACPYHAWTYGLDGALRGVPQQLGFPGLDRPASGLRPLALAERAGLAWVLADPDLADADVDAMLGPAMDELETLGLGTPPWPFEPRTLALRAHWTLLADGSFEAYHFQVAHRESIAPMFADNVQLVDEFGLNRRLYLVKSTLDPARPPDPAGFRVREHGNLIYFFFPNNFLLVQPDHVQLISAEPLGLAETAVHELTLLPEAPAGDKAIGHWRRNVALYRRTLGEDYALAESIQAGLASGANAALRFGRFEFAAARFHEQLDAALRDRVSHPPPA